MKSFLFRLFCTCVLFSFIGSANAQEIVTGHYLPGFGGNLLAGQLPGNPGFYLRNTTFSYQAKSTRDAGGKKIPGIDEVNVAANVTAIMWVPKWKIFNARYAAALAIPFANLAPYTVKLSGTEVTTGIGLGDVYMQPISLDWSLGKNVHVMTAYGLYAPTGKFKLGGSNNVGKGFWTHLLIAGQTYKDSSNTPWNETITVRYGIHSNQKGRDLTPGQTLSIDAGLGKFLTTSLNVGVTGFYWKQTTNATGRDANNILPYRLLGVGPAIQYVIKKWQFSIRVRDYYEFRARNMTQGNAFFIDFVKAFAT